MDHPAPPVAAAPAKKPKALPKEPSWGAHDKELVETLVRAFVKPRDEPIQLQTSPASLKLPRHELMEWKDLIVRRQPVPVARPARVATLRCTWRRIRSTPCASRSPSPTRTTARRRVGSRTWRCTTSCMQRTGPSRARSAPARPRASARCAARSRRRGLLRRHAARLHFCAQVGRASRTHVWATDDRGTCLRALDAGRAGVRALLGEDAG